MALVEMIDDIDRLVSNNGTVSQIKPLLITLREQAEALEKRVRTLESKSKVKNLEGQVDFLRAELDSALQQIQSFEDKEQDSHSSVEPDEETRILLFLSKHERQTARDIANALLIGIQKVEFYIEELFSKQMIDGAHYLGGTSEWFIAQEGRRHLLKKGLL
jgi:hypothetical protein